MVGGYEVVTTNKITNSLSGISSMLWPAFEVGRHSAPLQPFTKGRDKLYHSTLSVRPKSGHQVMLWKSDGTPVKRRGNVTCQRHTLSLVFSRGKIGKTHTSSKLSNITNIMCIYVHKDMWTYRKTSSIAVTFLEIWFRLWRSRIIN